MIDRFGLALYYALQMWIADAGLDDLLPLSVRTRRDADDIIATATSTSRGRVTFTVPVSLLEQVAATLTEAQVEEHDRDAKAQAFDAVQPYALSLMRKIDRMTHKGAGVGSGPDTRRQVRKLTDAGLSKRDIADRLNISEGTVAAARRATRG